MGFFDSVKDKAGALAADAERAGKVTAAQARLVVLQNDLKKAERELGHVAFSLTERGELDHPALVHAVERVRATVTDVRTKEAEIAALRGEAAPGTVTPPPPAHPGATSSAPGSTGTDVRAAEVSTIAPTAAAESPATKKAATTVQTAGGPVTVAPADVMAAAQAEAAVEAEARGAEFGAVAAAETVTAGEAEPSATPARKPARRKASAKTAAGGKKAPPRKPVAQKAPSAKAPASKAPPHKAGSTPKKTSKPSSAGPRPAGKKRPAGS